MQTDLQQLIQAATRRPLARVAVAILGLLVMACSTTRDDLPRPETESTKTSAEAPDADEDGATDEDAATDEDPATDKDAATDRGAATDKPDRDTEAAEEAAHLLAGYREISEMSSEQRRQTGERLRASLESGGCSPHRLRLAMLAFHEPNIVTDTTNLLAPCLEGSASAGASSVSLAELLDDLLASKRARQQARQGQDKLAREKRSLQQRNQDLKEQIEGLKNIERSLQRSDGN
jgi:hypothetical protein